MKLYQLHSKINTWSDYYLYVDKKIIERYNVNYFTKEVTLIEGIRNRVEYLNTQKQPIFFIKIIK